MLKGRCIQEISIGESADFSKTISETDSYIYAGITGDFNPVHINKEYSKKSVLESVLLMVF